jgi:hypothetical protein
MVVEKLTASDEDEVVGHAVVRRQVNVANETQVLEVQLVEAALVRVCNVSVAPLDFQLLLKKQAPGSVTRIRGGMKIKAEDEAWPFDHEVQFGRACTKPVPHSLVK